MIQTQAALSRQAVSNLAVYLAFAISLVLLLGQLGDPIGEKTVWPRLMDAGHVVLLAGLSLLVSLNISETDKRGQLRRFYFLLVFIIAIEIVQKFVGRSTSATDLENGVVGIVIGFVCAWLLRRDTSIKGWIGFIAFSAISFGVALIPAYREWQAVCLRNSQFPILGDFENPLALKIWIAPEKGLSRRTLLSLSGENVSEGKSSLRADRRNGAMLGFSYLAGKQDWHGYEKFSLDVYNPGGAGELRIRIDDSHDCRDFTSRFNRRVELTPGWNNIQIPVEEIKHGPKFRELDLSSIQRLLIFSDSPTVQVIYLDNVRLER